jgi:DNA helicase-2/ATP-dependent DNA helicase PcrA
MDKFTEAYEKLNQQQKLAVDTIEGPVMVVAGPGTGKTQILTLRIANILRKTQMNPRNILALTFTDNAAQNMRKRLIKIIDTAAYGVGIYTFHSFANLVITEFPYKFQFARELRQIDDIEQIEILEKLIDTLPLEELRPLRAPYHYLREILSRIGELKKENVSPQQLIKIARKEKEQLEQDPASFHEKGAHKGKMKAAIAEEIKQLNRSLELALVFQRYQQELTERGLYDYDDMILFVVQQFETDPELKEFYQERFQYVLVDEYQDTNNSQNRLVQLLTDFFESPNLFVVGDDKQSIFRFQGASLANMVLFHKLYADMKVVSLTENYRSIQQILDGADRLIVHAQERITNYLPDIHDTLHANKEAGELPGIELGSFASPDTERYWIAKKIQSLMEQDVAPEEIAVIYKENREAEAFADLFARLNIVYTVERGANVLTDSDVKRLITILRAIADPTDSTSLFSLLHYDFSEVNGVDILKIMGYRAKNHLSVLDVLTNLPCSCERHNFQPTEEQPALTFTDCDAIQNVIDRLSKWRAASSNKSIPELLEQVLHESKLFAQISESPTRIERFHRLRRFFEEVKRLSHKTADLTLGQLLAHIDLLLSNNIQLVPAPLEIENQTGAVKLMTAHKAKGLEFEHVFLPNLVDKHWGNGTRRTLIKLPSSIVARPTDAAHEKNEDDRRLFYVALTRAKSALYLTYPRAKEGKELLPSQFITELDGEQCSPIDTATNDKIAESQLLTLFSPTVETSFSEQEAAYIREVIVEQPLSPTGLNNYLRCPKGYFYRQILRIPTAKTAQQGYGTAIHAAMQAFFLKHKATKHVPSLEELLTSFAASLRQEIMSKVEYGVFLKEGTFILTRYYERHLQAVTPTVAVEYSFAPHHVVIPNDGDPIAITGILDKLELVDPQNNEIRVIDYKTGRARSRNEIEGKTATADADYKRQLIFYQMLSELDQQFPYKVVETGLAFIDGDEKFPIEKFVITKEEVEDLKQLIREVRKQMLDLEFPHIEDPKRPPCEFCDL